MSDDDLFQGRGRPLDPYAVKEADWPDLWRMPQSVYDGQEDGGIEDKMAVLADDIILRTAVNLFDNGARMPGVFSGVAIGMMSAAARFALVGIADHSDEAIEEAASSFASAFKQQFYTWRDVMRGGWDSLPAQDDD